MTATGLARVAAGACLILASALVAFLLAPMTRRLP